MRILLKIGSNILAAEKVGLNRRRIAALARDIALLREKGHQTLVVSSGAVAAGMKKVGFTKYPHDIRVKQAVAAIGQSSLMWAYEEYFGVHGIHVAQILLTRDDFKDRGRYINAKNTLETLLEWGLIPVVNENDSTSVDEMKFGDNDQLAALVSGMLAVDKMVILSDVKGLYDKNPADHPDAVLLDTVDHITDELLSRAGAAGSQVSSGGMYSKLIAAKKALSHGIPVHIVSGKTRGVLPGLLLDGKKHGTFFRPGSSGRLSSRKGWIAYSIRCKGSLHLDNGAIRALVERGKSLLPSGILKTEGTFSEGDAVECLDQQGRRIAKGLSNYSSEELQKIQGRKTVEIEGLLGYKYSDEVIHRDNLVLTPSPP